ncbi:hypothetical protein [Patulibacter minatonensis]|uniref:hypothetical protein n=1 Tax=Patulibacter minatonensis TaxID=298163 RepID=UPI00056ABA71|nr:hypothetical protein [Patulibacter minatonensis]
MRNAALRPLLVVLASGGLALGTASSASAHGGTKIAEGGTGGVTILTQAEETQTASGGEAVDISTTLEGPGTGKSATVVYYIRPKGGKTFRKTTTRDEAGIAHTDVPTADRGDWRSWDVSAVVDLSTGKRLRVSNAEANPPGPEPASTPGGGATGADDDEPGTTTATTPSSGGTSPDPGTDAAPATTTDGGSADDGGTVTAETVEDVSGKSDGTPGWVVPSGIVIVLAAVALAVVQQRRRTKDDIADED